MDVSILPQTICFLFSGIGSI